jgi:hypothetical protein
MTNEEKVEQYFQEIESVFGTREKMLTYLSNYESADEKTKEIFDQITVGRYHKEYWVKFEVKEPDLLNSFLMSWVVNGKSIAGVQGSVLDFGGVGDKNELKNKLRAFIDTL